ncbi:hypothetical protein [Winogradskyella sp. 3972H.M.0a.05]|uniref:hypothetical protein n=1 Tax=Winogradskyella sp. 3972H.M.0a.05 TaxID=2950277 RepID=UPI0033921064
MNVPSNISKSSLLAFVVFWAISFATETDILTIDMTPYVMFSFIPVFLVSSFVILSTVCPFFWLLEKDGFDKTQVFMGYFPYYVITTFSICAFFIISSDFDTLAIAFFASAFISTSQAWVWFAKEKSHEKV